MATEAAPRFFAPRLDGLSAEDFETASIRSAAPSYVSEAPSYHSTILGSGAERIPAYSPPLSSSTTSAGGAAGASGSERRHASMPTVRQGLPPIPPMRRRSDVPTLGEFRIPTWSTISSNPTARHYHSVATRRVERANELLAQAAAVNLSRVPTAGSPAAPGASSTSLVASAVTAPPEDAAGRNSPSPSVRIVDATPTAAAAPSLANVASEPSTAAAAAASISSGPAVMDHISIGNGNNGPQQQPAERLRPLEDPALVGEVAARRARMLRLAKENGDEVLLLEDKRWDWFLAQMKDWDERERSWNRFRRDYESVRTPKLARRIGGLGRLL